ncbi:hypothetical protein HII31_09590 [Pseudocercospora fuligena]|uniref:Uncharacterized protein n=1 Tax=Pseudocercospora fuligena TaxID=685502 RepID=A0A8H6RDN6_9PEZI|nr:hypothetical protein HII31_09590 [Pseudocercospora fuligena]
MDSNTEYTRATSISVGHNSFDANGPWRNPQIESPDDPAAANDIFRMADELPLDHPAFRSDPELFEHFEQSNGIIEQQWTPYQTVSQDRLQRDQEISLDTHASTDRHDSVTTGHGQHEEQAAAPPNDQTTTQTVTGAQSMPCVDLIYEIQQHLSGPHIDQSHDQHISEAEWQFYEAGVQELQTSQMPEAMAVPSHADSFQPDHGSINPSYTHEQDGVVKSDVPQALMNGDFPEPFDTGYGYTVSGSHGNHIYYPSALPQPHRSQPAFQEGSGDYAYPTPYQGDYGAPAHPDRNIRMPTYAVLDPAAHSQQASSAAQDRPQAIAPKVLLSGEQKVHLANLVQCKQVAYGDQINAMILSHELDYYPPMPLVPFPKQQERPSIDHGLPDQYEHLRTEEILSSAVHPDQMFGGLLLRLCKTYNNKELGAKIDALYGKRLSPSTYAHRISDAVDAFSRREGISSEEYRTRLNQQRPAQASKN